MQEGTPIHRRDILTAMGLLTAAVVSPAWPSWLDTPVDGIKSALDRMLTENPSIRRIGTAYLKQHVDESAPQTLLAALDGIVAREDIRRWRQSGPDHVETHVRQRICADFADGRTFSCDGWVLSLTEARLCAAAITVGIHSA